jgi:hypothetical protein
MRRRRGNELKASASKFFHHYCSSHSARKDPCVRSFHRWDDGTWNFVLDTLRVYPVVASIVVRAATSPIVSYDPKLHDVCKRPKVLRIRIRDVTERVPAIRFQKDSSRTGTYPSVAPRQIGPQRTRIRYPKPSSVRHSPDAGGSQGRW